MAIPARFLQMTPPRPSPCRGGRAVSGIKILTIISVILSIPVFSLCQTSSTKNLSGTIVIEKKPVEFTWLSTPDGTTDLPCFNYLPTTSEYKSGKGKEYIALREVKTIFITRPDREELKFIKDSCPVCNLYKAKITFIGQPENTGRSVYLALKYFTWKNTNYAEFSEPREAELRYVNAIYIK